MLAKFAKRTPLGYMKATKQPWRATTKARGLASVEGNTPRQMPASRARATPVSYDRATFTIRVRRATHHDSRIPPR